ncbi:UNVERIFIED_CONTAM: hypothetical protein FKN15_069388 [Acipenser sinensis]
MFAQRYIGDQKRDRTKALSTKRGNQGRPNWSQHAITASVDAGKGTEHLQSDSGTRSPHWMEKSSRAGGSTAPQGRMAGLIQAGQWSWREHNMPTQNGRAHPGRAMELEAAQHANAEWQGSSRQGSGAGGSAAPRGRMSGLVPAGQRSRREHSMPTQNGRAHLASGRQQRCTAPITLTDSRIPGEPVSTAGRMRPRPLLK